MPTKKTKKSTAKKSTAKKTAKKPAKKVTTKKPTKTTKKAAARKPRAKKTVPAAPTTPTKDVAVAPVVDSSGVVTVQQVASDVVNQ